jgi:hypothetical protein
MPLLICLLTALVVLWTTGSQQWFLPRAGWYDEFFYIGFGNFYFSEPDFHRNYYKASRIPWIIFQSVVRGLFNDTMADMVIGYGGVILLALAAFLVAKNFVPRAPAAFLAVVFALLPVNHGSGGWNYHNTLAGPLCLVAFWSITRTNCGTAGWLVAGALWAALLHTNITYVNFLLAIPLIIGWKKRGNEYLLMVIGGLWVTTALGLVAMMAGRDFDFWRLQFNLAREFVMDPSRQTTWYHPLSVELLWRSKYLWFPLTMALVSAGSLALCRDLPGKKLVVLHGGMVLLWFFWQLAGQTALDWNHFSYPLQQTSFLCLVGLCAPAALGREKNPGITTLAWSGGAGISALFLTSCWGAGFHPQEAQVALLLAAGSAVLLMGRKSTQLTCLGGGLLMLLLMAGERSRYESGNLGESVNHAKISFIYQLMRESKEELSQGDKTILWYDEDENFDSGTAGNPTEKLGVSFAPSFACLGFSFLGRPPAVPIERLPFDEKIQKGFSEGKYKIILLTNQEEKARRFLDYAGKKLPFSGFYYDKRIQQGSLAIRMYKLGDTRQLP